MSCWDAVAMNYVNSCRSEESIHRKMRDWDWRSTPVIPDTREVKFGRIIA
jgi:hypothetical protein